MTASFSFPVVIQKQHLDAFNHMNNATYLQLFEEARWAILNNAGYTIERIQEIQLGPTILTVTVSFLREIRLGDHIIIQSQTIGHKKKVVEFSQKMVRAEEVCCEAVFTMGLFSLEKRKLVSPTNEWLSVLGLA